MKLQSANIFALVTGASRGFGVSIVNQFLSQVLPHAPSSITLTLLSSPRSQSSLSSLKADLLSSHPHPSTTLSIHTVGLDLQSVSLDEASTIIQPPDQTSSSPDVAILFSNAGIMQPGRLDSGLAAGPSGLLGQSLAVNTVAVGTLLTAFLQVFPSSTQRYLVYTSTICAVHPFPSWPAYCVSKAASEMLHRVAVTEHPDVRALLYAPGAMDTDMAKVITGDVQSDPGIVRGFEHMRETGSFVSTDASAAKMIRILLQDEFENCQHIDVSD